MVKISKILALVLMLIYIPTAYASDLRPYEAVYKTKLKGFNVNVKRRLQVQDSTITVSYDAKQLMLSVHESSILSDQGDCVLRPTKYVHKRRGLSHEHDKDLIFNWTDNTVLDLLKPERTPLPLENPSYDKLSYQTQMRLDLICNPDLHHVEYAVTNGIRNRKYAFHRLGEEILNTPLGNLRTIKFEREGGDDERQVFVWLAPDWEYLLVRLDQIKEPGAKVERLILKKAKIADEKVVGL